MKIIRNNIILSGIEDKDLFCDGPLVALLKNLNKKPSSITIEWIEDDLVPWRPYYEENSK